MTDYKLTKHENGYTVTTPGSMEFDFDREGRLVRLVDANGKSVSLEYQDDTTVITDDISGKHLYLHYNEERLLTSVTDDNDRVTRMVYDADSNLTDITNTIGETVHYAYDEEHRILSERGEEGVIVQNVYDKEGRVVEQTDAYGEVMKINYTTQAGNTVVTVEDPDGTTKKMIVDEKEQVLVVINADGGTTRYTYDKDGNEVSEVDAEGNAVFKTYDKNGNLQSIKGTMDCGGKVIYEM